MRKKKKSFKVHILLFVLTAFYSVPHLGVTKLTKLSVLFNHNHQFYIKTINDNKMR